MATRRNEILFNATTGMELEVIMPSERSQSEKDISYVFTHVELEKLNRRPWGNGGGKIVTEMEGGTP